MRPKITRPVLLGLVQLQEAQIRGEAAASTPEVAKACRWIVRWEAYIARRYPEGVEALPSHDFSLLSETLTDVEPGERP